VEVRRIAAGDIVVLNRRLGVWNGEEYGKRLVAQDHDQLVQAVAWFDQVPGGRGMVLFPEHEEFSASAVREGCAEVRDVFVARPRRRLGVATALMDVLEARRDLAVCTGWACPSGSTRRPRRRERCTSASGTATPTGRSSRART
jgi:GNAT superfamily N-acetyltransferase